MLQGPLEVTDVTKTSIKLKWKKPEDDGGTPIKEYEVEKLDTATGKWVQVDKIPGDRSFPEMDVTGLTPGQEYKFRVTAINEEGDSESLVTDKSTIAKNPYDEPTKPGTPEITDYDNESVNLKWTKPESDGGTPIEKYIGQIEKRFKPDWERAVEVPGDQLEAKVPDLKERAEYQFRVIAVNKAGPSPASDPTKTHLVKHKASAPSRPKGPLKVSDVTKNGCKLKWDKPEDDDGKPVTGYVVENIDTSSGRWVPVGKTNDREMDVKGLQEGQEYKFRVRAVNEEGESEPLETECATLAENPFDIPSRPGTPDIVHCEMDCVDLKWEAPKSNGGAPITGYIIEKKEKFSPSWDEILTTTITMNRFSPTPPPSPTDLDWKTPEEATELAEMMLGLSANEKIILLNELRKLDLDTLLVLKINPNWQPPPPPRIVVPNEILDDIATWGTPNRRDECDDHEIPTRWIFHFKKIAEINMCRQFIMREHPYCFGISQEMINMGFAGRTNYFADAVVVNKVGVREEDIFKYDFFQWD